MVVNRAASWEDNNSNGPCVPYIKSYLQQEVDSSVLFFCGEFESAGSVKQDKPELRDIQSK